MVRKIAVYLAMAGTFSGMEVLAQDSSAPASAESISTKKKGEATAEAPLTALESWEAGLNASLQSMQYGVIDAGNHNRLFKARLTGSLCFACLKQLKQRLKKVDGILAIRISSSTPSDNGSAKKLYTLELVYDDSKLDRKKIKKEVQHNDFGTANITDAIYASKEPASSTQN